MNVMEEIFEMYRNSGEWYQSQHSWWVYALQLTENCKVYMLEDLHPLGGKNVLNMRDLFEDDYKEFVLGQLENCKCLTVR